MKTGLDNEFHELNALQLNPKQRDAMWRNIQRKSKKSNKSAGLFPFKYVAISVLALAFMLILTINLIDLSGSKRPHTQAPKTVSTKKAAPPKPAGEPEIRDNSKGWQLGGRMRYDVAIIGNINPDSKELSQLEVRSLQSFGSDTDPVDPDVNMHEPSKTYNLQTILNQQVLHFHQGQKILMTKAQYSKRNSDLFDGAKVLGYAKEDGRFYDLKGNLLNLKISSQVSIVDGELKTKQ